MERRALLVCAALLTAVSSGGIEMRLPRTPQRVTLRVPSGARPLLRFYGGERDVEDQEVTSLAPPRDLKVRVLPTVVLVTWSDPVKESRPTGADRNKRFYTVRYRQMVPAAPWFYQTAMTPRVIITHVMPGTRYEIAARVSEGEKDGPWCTPVMARTHAHAYPEEDYSISSANQKPEILGLRPTEREDAPKQALLGRGERRQHQHRGVERVTATKRRTEPHGADPQLSREDAPVVTSDTSRTQPDALTRHLWLVDTEQNLLYTKDGNVVYDEKGLPVRLCVAEDGYTIITEDRQPVLTRSGSLVLGFNTLAAAAAAAAGGGNKTATSRSETGGSLPASKLLHDKGHVASKPRAHGESGGLVEDKRDAPGSDPVGGEERTVSVGDNEGTFPDEDESTASDGAMLGYGATEQASRAGGRDGSPSSEPHVKLLKKMGSLCSISDALEQIPQHVPANKNIQLSKTSTYLRKTKVEQNSGNLSMAGAMGTQPIEPMVVAVEGCPSFVVLEWSPAAVPPGDTETSGATGYVVQVANSSGINQHRWFTAGFTNSSFLPVENLQPNEKYYFKVKTDIQTKPEVSSNILMFVTGSESKEVADRSAGISSVWTPFAFYADPQAPSACAGKRYVKRTLQHKLVGVSLCNSLRYKIYLGEDLRGTFYALGDAEGHGEDHCEFVDSPWDGKTGPLQPLENLTNIDGYHRSKRQQRLLRGILGRESGLYHVSWYECGVAIPGIW